jgi:hypothetical protein
MAMSRTTTSLTPPLAGERRGLAKRAHLRLVKGARTGGPPRFAGEPPAIGGHPDAHDRQHDREQVLVAGSDASARASMLAELRSLLPAETCFVEASETWEMIARSAGSRMVVLTGDLGEASASSLLRLLARRNPALPVLVVGDADRRQAGPQIGHGLHASAQAPGPDDERRRAVDAAHA